MERKNHSVVDQESNELKDTMDVAYLKSLKKVEIESIESPVVTQDEVLIKIMAVGICGSDIHYYTHGHIGKRKVQYPHIQGHECAGEVVKVGKDITKFKVGDRVAVEPGLPCNSCEWCKTGKYNLCPVVKFLSTPPIEGAFVQYLKHREDFLFKIDDTLSYEIATLAEPLSVGIHALRRAAMEPGKSVLITGMGPVGLMTVLAAKTFGSKNIIVSDLEPSRLELAIKLGATHAVNLNTTDLESSVNDIMNNEGVDLVIEASGSPNALSSSIKYVKRGCKVVSIGFPLQDEVPIDMTYMLQNEIDLYTVYRYTNTYPLALDILKSNVEEVQSVITDRFALRDIQLAMEKATIDKKDTIKVIVFPHIKKEDLK